MKIYVFSRKKMLDIKGTEVESELFRDYNIISINTPSWGKHLADEDTPPFSAEYLNSKNFLSVWFHDLTRKNHENDILISEEQAEQIASFIKTMDKSKDLIVHCSAGISRSGAVGVIANDYLNAPESNDYKFFWQNHKHIQPNWYVISKIKRKLGMSFN